MARKASGEFDQIKYQNVWKKQNMKQVGGSYKNEFVEEFKRLQEAWRFPVRSDQSGDGRNH